VRQREKIQEVLREVMEAYRIGMKKPARITRAERNCEMPIESEQSRDWPEDF
jgi:hypothetical protein